MDPYLRVLNDLVIIMTSALEEVISDVKTELPLLITALESNPDYAIPESKDYARRLQESFDFLSQQNYRSFSITLGITGDRFWRAYLKHVEDASKKPAGRMPENGSRSLLRRLYDALRG